MIAPFSDHARPSQRDGLAGIARMREGNANHAIHSLRLEERVASGDFMAREALEILPIRSDRGVASSARDGGHRGGAI